MTMKHFYMKQASNPVRSGFIESQLFSMQAEYIGKLYLAKDDAEFDKIIDEWRTKAENINYMDYYNHINPIIEAAYLEYLAGRN